MKSFLIAVLGALLVAQAAVAAPVRKAQPQSGLLESAPPVARAFDAADANILSFGGAYYFTGTGGPRFSVAYDAFLSQGFSLAPRVGLTVASFAFPSVGVRASFWPLRASDPAATQIRLGVGSDLWITGGAFGTPVLLFANADIGIQIPLSQRLVLEPTAEVSILPFWLSQGVAANAGLQLGMRL